MFRTAFAAKQIIPARRVGDDEAIEVMVPLAMKLENSFSWNVVTKNFHAHEQLRRKLRSKLTKLERHLQRFLPEYETTNFICYLQTLFCTYYRLYFVTTAAWWKNAKLFHRHALGEIAGLIHVATARDGHMVGEQL